MKTEQVIDHISGWLKDYCTKNYQKGFVVGVSGGIDSAVTSALCARTGLPTLCVEMPIHQAASHVTRALEHVADLQKRHANVSLERVDLTPTFDTMERALPDSANDAAHQLALANSRARLRMTTLYYLAGVHGYLVAGTGNKVEDFGVGFYTKYGDGGVDLSPIADLKKTEVYALAKQLGIVESIQRAAPSDGLFGDDRSDEDQIGASYPELEWAMEYRAQHGMALRVDDPQGANVDDPQGANVGDPQGIDRSLTDRQRHVLGIYDRRNAANRHKMEPIPVCIIPAELKS